MHTALHLPVIWIISPVQRGVCAMCQLPIRQQIKIAKLLSLAQFLINSNSFATRWVPHYENCLYIEWFDSIGFNKNSNTCHQLLITNCAAKWMNSCCPSLSDNVFSKKARKKDEEQSAKADTYTTQIQIQIRIQKSVAHFRAFYPCFSETNGRVGLLSGSFSLILRVYNSISFTPINQAAAKPFLITRSFIIRNISIPLKNILAKS